MTVNHSSKAFTFLLKFRMALKYPKATTGAYVQMLISQNTSHTSRFTPCSSPPVNGSKNCNGQKKVLEMCYEHIVTSLLGKTEAQTIDT